MSRARIAALCAAASNRRIDLCCPQGSGRAHSQSERAASDRQIKHWRRAWERAWALPARTTAELLARARLVIADPYAMDVDETLRLARDVVALIEGGRA